jgi:hypothetical protein
MAVESRRQAMLACQIDENCTNHGAYSCRSCGLLCCGKHCKVGFDGPECYPCRYEGERKSKEIAQRDRDEANKVLLWGLGIGVIGWIVYIAGAHAVGIVIFVIAGLVGAFWFALFKDTL